MTSIAELADREATDLAWLTGPRARHALAAALGPQGARLLEATVHEVHHRPGAGITVGYDVRLRTQDGQDVADYLLLTTSDIVTAAAPVPAAAGEPPVAENAATIRPGTDLPGRVLHVWRHPDDPLLPGLAAACTVEDAARRVGFDAADGVSLELIGYRPLRRAVLALTGPSRRVYLKVVRPDQLEILLARNRCAEPAGAPPVLDVWPEAVLVFAQARGEPLPELLARDGAAGVDPHEFLRCLDALDPAGLALPLRPAWTERSGYYADAARGVLPHADERISALAAGIVSGLARVPAGPPVVTHGDFHAANILMDDARIASLLDVDTLGPGQRVDDLACLIGHLAVLPSLAPGVYPHVPGTIDRWLGAFDRYVDPVALRLRAAGVVLSLLASMPAHVEQEARRQEARDQVDGSHVAGVDRAVAATHADAEARLVAAERFVADAFARLQQQP